LERITITIIPVFGGHGGGSISEGTAGVSFVVVAKLSEWRLWSKIFDFGSSLIPTTEEVLMGWISSFQTIEFDTMDNNQYEHPIWNSTVLVSVNEWYHFVAVSQIRGPSNTSVYPAVHRLYIDGLLVASEVAPHPTAVGRPDCFLGRSHWPADPLLPGLIDDFSVYDEALNDEQVEALYVNSMFPNRPLVEPFFSATFNRDPTRGTERDYKWLRFDPNDDPEQQRIHHGLLVLDGSEKAFVNLSTLTGPNSVGLELANVGGWTGRGSIAEGSAGWSFEVTLKPGKWSPWMKIMDLGNGLIRGIHEILLGYSYVPNALQFLTSNADDSSEYGVFVTTPVLNEGSWMHIVGVLQIANITEGNYNSFYNLYFNGKLLQSSFGINPGRMHRADSLLGKSNWASDPTLIAEIDTFNVYDLAFDQLQVFKLYEYAML